MDTENSESSRNNVSSNIEFRVMPSGDGHWYWEIVRGGQQVIMCGVADSEPAACKEVTA